MDDLRERLLRAEGARPRPRVTVPDVATLRRLAFVRAVRRGVIAMVIAAVGTTWTMRWIGRAPETPWVQSRSPARLDAELAVIAAKESAAAVRLALAMRAVDPRPDLRVILDRFPDTSSARRAQRMLDPVPHPRHR